MDEIWIQLRLDLAVRGVCIGLGNGANVIGQFSYTPQPISEEKLAKHLAEAAAAAGIEADKVYAISETGLIPTSRSPEEVKQEFKRAMDRYHKLKRQ